MQHHTATRHYDAVGNSSLEVFFSQSVPPPVQDFSRRPCGLGGKTTAGRNGDLDIAGRADLSQPLGALFFPHLAMPTGPLILPTGPPPGPNRELAMPTRKRTRAQDRAYRVQWERELNRARFAADPPPF